eukprot:SAG31_NODE_2383_length_5825_cov_13.209745_4_plen_54_part_00
MIRDMEDDSHDDSDDDSAGHTIKNGHKGLMPVLDMRFKADSSLAASSRSLVFW